MAYFFTISVFSMLLEADHGFANIYVSIVAHDRSVRNRNVNINNSVVSTTNVTVGAKFGTFC